MASKNFDLEKPLQVKLDRWSDGKLRQDAEDKTISLSTLLRQIVREHYKRLDKRRRTH